MANPIPLTRRQRRRVSVQEHRTPWSRSWRRAISRNDARKHVLYNGPSPRYEPARNDTCTAHHRKLPCKRCTEAAQ